MLKKSTLIRLINFYPPYLGAGVRVRRISADFREIDVEMRLRFWNKNYLGTHFGGSLYAMVDPFYVLMLSQNLGPEYEVWDKAATVRFLRPGRGLVKAAFRLSPEEIGRIRGEADATGRSEPAFTVRITDGEGKPVAEVEKIISVKRKAPMGAR